MKFTATTILSVSALLCVSTTSGQKTRGSVERALNGGGPYGGKGSRRRMECVCDGFFYYEFMELGIDASWSEAYLATPNGCVLAPVKSAGDLKEIEEAAQDANAWVGMIKSAGDIADPAIALTAGWYNLDGSEVPDDMSLWGAFSSTIIEPNNDPAYQTRAHWWGSGFDEATGRSGLRDLNPVRRAGPNVTGAVYKCCGENVNTCDDFPMEKEDY